MANIDIFETANALNQQARNAGRNRRRWIGGALMLLLGGGYAVWHSGAAQSATEGAAPPALPVSVQTLAPETVKPFATFSGRIHAVDFAEIRPQVSGRITEIRFRDGEEVKAGQILFVIDPRPFQAAVNKAAADLQSARTNASLAKVNLHRAETLKKDGAIALQSYDQAASTAQVGDAAIASAEAVLAQARLDLDHAYVKAPIAGRISRAEITLGNLVGASPNPPLLASIASKDGVYADFEVDEGTYLSSVRGREQGLGGKGAIPVELRARGDNKVYQGAVYSFDNHIDAGSGTIRARARFANEDGALVPGMFVGVRMGGATLSQALLVPEGAVGNDQSKRFVFVVSKDGKAEYREVALGAALEGRRVVLSGLKSGDRVILDGLQKLGPGAPVAPRPETKS
jgi:multidrug efflux system membrane fusion protein